MKRVESLAENLYPKQTEAIPSLTEILKLFFRNINIALRMLNVQGFYLKRKRWALLLMGPFNETHVLASVKYVAEESINVSNFLELHELLGLHFCALYFKR